MVDSGDCGDGCHFDCVGGVGASSHHRDRVRGRRRRRKVNFDMMTRSIQDFVGVFKRLNDAGVGLVSITQGIV